MPFEVILLRAFSCENARKPAEFGAEALGRGAFPRIDVDFVKAIALVVSSRRALSMMGREATLFGTANDGTRIGGRGMGIHTARVALVSDVGADKFCPVGWLAHGGVECAA